MRATKRGHHRRGDTLKILDSMIEQEALNGSFRLNTDQNIEDNDDELNYSQDPLTKSML